MSDDFEMVEIQDLSTTTNGLQVYQQDKALIDMQIATAKQYPRRLGSVINNAIAIVTMDKETAEKCNYALKKGGKLITGPSVHLARIIAKQMGNMRVEQSVIGADDTHVTVSATCFDLERNYAVRTIMRKSVVGSSGRYSEDMIVITGNAAAAIAFRNAVFSVVPEEITNKVYKAALTKITGDLSDETKLIAARTRTVEMFKKTYPDYNLTDAEIAASVGKSSIEHIGMEEISALIGFDRSIKDGEITVLSVFRPEVSMGERPMRKVVLPQDKSEDRLIQLIKSAKSRKDLEKYQNSLTTQATRTAYDDAYKNLK